MLKRISVIISLLLVSFAVAAEDIVVDIEGLAQKEHPRLIMSADDFDAVRLAVSKRDGAVEKLHKRIMTMGNRVIKENVALQYTMDASGTRLLAVSRDALMRISVCSYIYKVTGKKIFLEYAQRYLNEVCSFKDWNHRHFLDVAEMALAVSIGYDWLYDDLTQETRATVERALGEYAIVHAVAEKEHHYYRKMDNWNQVCNGGMVAAAIAVCDKYPEQAETIVQRAVRTNRKAVEVMYAPHGNYFEGYAYWKYGTSYQIFMLKALEKAFGTDYGLSQVPGFLSTGDFMLYMEGINGAFNHSDSGGKISPSIAMWYFADKLQRPDLLYNEMRLLNKNSYSARYLPLIMCFAINVPTGQIARPQTNLWYGKGLSPLFMARRDWTSGPDDAYLAVKGGKASNNHGHMDVGSFVYDAYGVRWSMDLGPQNYGKVEKKFREIGGNLWSMKQDSKRWSVSRYNNFRHSTITVNDSYHVVDGFGDIIEHFDDKRGKGAVLDMTQVLGEHVKSAERTVILLDDNSLSVTDKVMAPEDKSVNYSWRMVTKAKPEVKKNCILLKSGDVCLKLRARSDVKVTYRTWSAEPVESYDDPNPGVIIVGIEATVPPSETAEFAVSLQKNLW